MHIIRQKRLKNQRNNFNCIIYRLFGFTYYITITQKPMTSILTQRRNDQILSLIKAIEENDMNQVVRIADADSSLDVINGIPINDTGVQQFTALHTAIAKNNLVMVNRLLDMGADPNIGSDKYIYYPDLEEVFGITPLYLAIDQANAMAVKALLLHGADANHYIANYPIKSIDDRYETMPLSFALASARYEPEKMFHIIDYILSSGQQLDDIYKSVKYPTLIRPIKKGLYSIATLLLDKYVHANPNEIEIDSQNSSDIRERRSVLMVAIKSSTFRRGITSSESRGIISNLLHAGANPNNIIGFEYTIRDILHPEQLGQNDYLRQSSNYYTAKEIIGGEITDFVSNYNRDQNYKSYYLMTSLDYAFALGVSSEIIALLISYGALLTKRILHNEGIIVSSGDASQFNNITQSHINKIISIPNITSEQYAQCIQTMGSGDNKEMLSDFITTEDVAIENTVMLPSNNPRSRDNTNTQTCMDRNSFSKYVINKMNNNMTNGRQDPITNPFTREVLRDVPEYSEWINTNYPLGMNVDYNAYRSGSSPTPTPTLSGGKRSRTRKNKVKRTRTRRGRGPETSRMLYVYKAATELKKDAKVVYVNIETLLQSRDIFDQYRGKTTEQLPEKVQQRMSKYSGLVVPIVDFIQDVYVLRESGKYDELPGDIIILTNRIIALFEIYPFLATIGMRSPTEGYDFITKIQDMTRKTQQKNGGKRRSSIKKKKRETKKSHKNFKK